MIKKAITSFSVLILGLMIASCEKIKTQEFSGDPIDFSKATDHIPLQYGRLVSSTQITPNANILWFEQTDQTLVGVRVNVSRNIVSTEVIRIERK